MRTILSNEEHHIASLSRVIAMALSQAPLGSGREDDEDERYFFL